MTSTTSALDQFAARFIRDINHYRDVRSEELAEAFRQHFELPPFPTIHDLRAVCVELDIPVWRLPEGLQGVDGANFSTPKESAILIRRDLSTGRTETTLTHEIREVLENAFIRIRPDYEGRSTHDNRMMNSASDRFGGYLLMQTRPAHRLMVELGYDLRKFAGQTRRSLPSVLKRVQQLYSTKSELPAPVIGVWLFEAPWEAVKETVIEPHHLKLVGTAKLSGFSQRSGTAAFEVFPTTGTTAADFRLTATATREQRTVGSTVREMDVTPERDFLVIAEPVIRHGNAWRVLLTAVRIDGKGEIGPWLERVESAMWLPDQVQLV